MRLPINTSTEFDFLGEANFRLVFFIASGLGDLKKAIALNSHVAIRIRMKYGLSFRHQNPIFALDVSRQAGARHRR